MRGLSDKRARWLRVRVGMLAFALFAFAAAVAHRAYVLQIARAPHLRDMAEAQYLRDLHIAPKRGTIYDRNGAELAVSVEVPSVFANPRQLRANGGDPARLARRLGKLLGADPATLRERLESDRYFVWLKRRISPAQADAVEALDIPGVRLTSEAQRFYPNRDLAAHVLGFTNIDGKGIDGLERTYQEQLEGAVERVPAVRDRRGQVVFSEQLFDDRAALGDDLTLTIDKDVQHVAERELALGVDTFEARDGSVVVMDPNTGEILAMASVPTYNPNQPGDAPPANRRNRAVRDRFEPGSTVKPFVIGAALAKGTVTPGQVFDCEDGRMRVGRFTIHDAHPEGAISVARILQVSSNIGTVKIGRTLGREGIYDALHSFGFG